mmetsp:Transcript_5809/g.14165  ORF Transcript_5809/g.14165 Transcript_5809/m.14165 type:complete len:141 (+) Transcript_5809:409-831(+)|eukprot:CAMPEP_0113464598 /NCGR_PEP_ID=MMETSP0014_2-20120614/13285_1 /TAXON_ID=2857 /ORGANISM="Nitzschia sp." /LENGTH=140 /DNA_ID=CAMNT_0000356687 /DNA_START=178 /DNA_END=600 /DNA_ORIENTATION=+ /assembly_acc=CAM_ASM_000159
MLATRLSRIVIMARAGEGFARAVEFYASGLGLQVVRATDDWAVFDLRSSSSSSSSQQREEQGQNLTLCLQAVTSESQLSTGYSPMLQFQVQPDSINETIAKCIQLGASMDGPIQYPAHGTMAALRGPDGQMIGLYEPTTE